MVIAYNQTTTSIGLLEQGLTSIGLLEQGLGWLPPIALVAIALSVLGVVLNVLNRRRKFKLQQLLPVATIFVFGIVSISIGSTILTSLQDGQRPFLKLEPEQGETVDIVIEIKPTDEYEETNYSEYEEYNYTLDDGWDELW